MSKARGISWCEYPDDFREWRAEVAYYEEQPNFIPEPKEEVKVETVEVEPTAEEIERCEARKLHVECHKD